MPSRGVVELVFIGTSSATPSRERWLPAILVKLEGEFLLMDCGEGTQYRVFKAGLRVNKLSSILITHMHGDHVYGLPGLLESLGMWGRQARLRVYGPRGIREFLEGALTCRDLGYELEVEEVRAGTLISTECYRVVAIPVKHTVEAYAYALIERDRPGKFDDEKARELGIPPGPLRRRLLEGFSVKLPSGRLVMPREVVGPPRKGLKVVYSGDTAPVGELVEASRRADLLVHEATFSSDLVEEAHATGHSTAEEAARCALEAQVKLLVLFHYSSRYRDLSPLVNEARKVFKRTYASYDMMRLRLVRLGVNGLLATFTKIRDPEAR